jgi:hypothetical protein
MNNETYPGCSPESERCCVHGNPWGGTCGFCDGRNNVRVDVTIVSIWSKRAPGDSPVRYDVRVLAGGSPTAPLNRAYAQTNVDERPHAQEVPTTSTGDLMLCNGQWWFVDVCGFTRLTAEQARVIEQRLTSRDTSFGLADLVREGKVPS